MKKELSGSITVFLSITLLLVLSIIFTTIEVNRVQLYYVQSNRSMVAAMDSLFAQYNKELFENYHIFGLYTKDCKDETEIQNLLDELSTYMQYTFEPEKDLEEVTLGLFASDWIYHNFNLYDIKLDEIKATKVTSITENQGVYFEKEGIDYVKQTAMSTGIKDIIGWFTPIKEASKLERTYEEKRKMEENLLVQEEYLMELMCYIDGVPASKKGIVTDNNGKFIPKQSFVKKFFPYQINQINSKINNSWIYQSIQSDYINPIVLIDGQIKQYEAMQSTYNEIESLESDSLFYSLIDMSVLPMEEKDRIIEERRSIELSILAKGKEVKAIEKSINATNHIISELIKDTKSSIDKSLKVLEHMEENQGNIQSSMKSYEEYLTDAKEELSSEIYEVLSEEADEVKQSYGISESQNSTQQSSLTKMKITLQNNNYVVEKLLQCIVETKNTTSLSQENFTRMKELCTNFSFQDLSLDYSSINKPSLQEENIVTTLNNLFGKGLLSLLIEDTSTLSEKTINTTNISTSQLQLKSSTSLLDYGQSLLKTISTTFSNVDSSISTILEKSDTLLYYQYLQEHFSNYKESNKRIESTALDYELEFLIHQDASDKENLSNALESILLMRTMMNFSTILLDKTSNGKAREVATLLVGFTGMPAVVELLKYTLLLLQSFVESMVDVIAMLNGTKLPLLKKQADLKIKTEDILTINKTILHEKAKTVASNKIGLGYKEQICLLLMMKNKSEATCAAVNLIERNIQKNYDEDFYMKNIICQMEIEANVSMPIKFINFIFIDEILSTHSNQYSYKIQKTYEY